MWQKESEQSKKLTNKRKMWVELNVLERVKKNVLKWFGHVERMEEERLVKRVYQEMCRVTGGGGRNRRENGRMMKG